MCWNEKRKVTQLKQTIQNERINQKGTGERRKTKKISRQDQTKQTKQDIKKKKILPAIWGRMYEDILTNGCKGSETILEQNMGMEVHKRKAEWIKKNMEKRFTRT